MQLLLVCCLAAAVVILSSPAGDPGVHTLPNRADWVAFVAEQQLELPAAAVDRFVDQVLRRVWQVRL